MMNRNISEGKWRQVRGMIKQQWGKLTDDQLEQVNGNMDRLAGQLQEQYGYSQEQARAEVNRFMSMHEKDFR